MEILENSIFQVTGQRLDWQRTQPKLFSSGWFTVLNSRYKLFLVLWWFNFSMNSFQIDYKLTQNVPKQAWKIINFRRLSSELLRSPSELTETLRSWYEESTIDPWFFTTILWCFFNIFSRWYIVVFQELLVIPTHFNVQPLLSKALIGSSSCSLNKVAALSALAQQ